MKRTIDQKQHFGHLRLNDPFAVHQLETQLCIISTVSDNESTSHDGNHHLGLYLPCLPRKFRVTFYKKAVQNEILRKILCIVRMMVCGLLRNALSNKKLWHQTIHRLFSQHITPMQWGLNCLVLAKTFSLWVLHRNFCTLLQGLFWYLAKYRMLRLQHPSLDPDKLDRHVFEHPASQQLMPFIMRKNNVRLFSRLWRINVQVFTLCWSVTDTSMNTWIMVIGQPEEGSGSFKNQQSTTISSHSMLGINISLGQLWYFTKPPCNSLKDRHLISFWEDSPISNPWFAMRSLWSTSLKFWMEHFVKKLLQWLNLDTSHSPSWNWKSIFQTDIMQLHGRIFPKYKWLESYVRLVWLDILRC